MAHLTPLELFTTALHKFRKKKQSREAETGATATANQSEISRCCLYKNTRSCYSVGLILEYVLDVLGVPTRRQACANMRTSMCTT